MLPSHLTIKIQCYHYSKIFRLASSQQLLCLQDENRETASIHVALRTRLIHLFYLAFFFKYTYNWNKNLNVGTTTVGHAPIQQIVIHITSHKNYIVLFLHLCSDLKKKLI